MDLFYRTLGEGEPLFILHGLLGSSDNWMTLGKKFAEEYFVVLVDLRNHGRSPKSDRWDYMAMANDIYELTRKLKVAGIRLVGHSMGGKVGMTIAGEYPKLLDKLVVADIAPKYYPIRHRKIMDGLLSIDLLSIKSRKDAEMRLSHYIPEPGIRQFLLKNLDRDSKNGFSWKLNLEVINDHLENVGAETIPGSKISIPSLFVRGINSDYVSDEDVFEIRKYYTNSRVETIGNAGHWIHAEQPEAFMSTVLDFLRD